MTTINTALRRIMTIPREVLQQAFTPRRFDPTRRIQQYDFQTPLSLDSIITDTIIYGRVLPDIDLVSGNETELNLSTATIEHVDLHTTIYRFDDRATGGRTITSVQEIAYGKIYSPHYGHTAHINYNTQQGMFQKSTKDILRSVGGPRMNTNHLIHLVGHNTVYVSGDLPRQDYGVLRCILSNDPNLNNIRPHYQQPFATLVLLATKSHIYTHLLIDLDEGQLLGGQRIGRFREIVDSYADAEEMYQEELDTWYKMGLMNDPTQHRKVMRMALGSRPKW